MPVRRPSLLKSFLLQVFLLLVTVVGLWFVERVMAYSALFGGLIAVVPNAYFARHAFKYSGAQAARQVANSFYRGEAGKFLLTVVLFAAVFSTVKPLNVVALFAAYLAMTLVNVLFAARVGNNRGAS